jgi:hypothetical protein
VKSNFVRFFILFRKLRRPHEPPFFKAQRRLLIGTHALTSNNSLLQAAGTLRGPECARRAVAAMSRFDVCSAVQQSDIARQIVPIFQSARVGLKEMCFAVGQEVGTFPGKFVCAGLQSKSLVQRPGI